MSREACQRMHIYESFEIAGTCIIGLISNLIASRPIVLDGHVDHDEACTGGTYFNPYETWGNVLVLGNVKIILQDYIADVNTNIAK